MLIYGHRNHETVVAIGEFYCAHCQAQRSFKQKRVDRYLTLFFISTIRLGRLNEYVECQTCLSTFDIDVLKLPLDGSAPASTGQVSAQAARVTPIPPNYTRHGCALAVLGALAFVVGAIIGLFTIFVQLTDEAGVGNNVEGFIGVLVICPAPLVCLGLTAFVGGLVIYGRNRGKTTVKP